MYMESLHTNIILVYTRLFEKLLYQYQSIRIHRAALVHFIAFSIELDYVINSFSDGGTGGGLLSEDC